jgi:hypothetical protein
MSTPRLPATTLAALALALISLVEPNARAEETTELKLNVAPLLDLNAVAAMTPKTLETLCKHEHYERSPMLRWKDEATKTEAFLVRQPYTNIHVELMPGSEALSGVTIEEVRLFFTAGKCVKVTCQSSGAEAATHLLNTATTALSPPVNEAEPLLSGWLSTKDTRVRRWSTSAGVARLETMPAPKASCLAMAVAGQALDETLLEADTAAATRDGRGPITGVTMQGAPRTSAPSTKEVYHFFIRVGQLMVPEVLWRLTPASIESKLPKPIRMTSNPLFDWSTSSRDGVRIGRKPSSNVEQSLLLFDDAVEAEEVLIDFKQGVARQLTVSVLNSGDSGSISQEKFDIAYRAVGKGLSHMMGVKPTPHSSQGVGAVKGFSWKNAHTTALLEHNVEATKGSPKFLRIRMAPNIASQALTTNHFTEGRMTPLSRDATTGTVMITSVPMVDQGQKGYCVAATCQRVLNYLGVVCDQHQLAELLQTTAEGGTSVSVMYEALTKVNLKFGSKFKAVAARVKFTEMRRKDFEKLKATPLMTAVRAFIDRRAPLLWCVDLGLSPSVPGQPQMVGGHMRLIIGYNEKESRIIYTDSWGAGHERKEMTLQAAEACTEVVFVLD